jgi:hypothetical protein
MTGLNTSSGPPRFGPDLGQRLADLQRRVQTLEGSFNTRAAAAWQVPTLLNGWTNTAGGWPPIAYYIDGNARVFHASPGTRSQSGHVYDDLHSPRQRSASVRSLLAVSAFQLPIYVDTTGVVIAINATASNSFSLDAVSFRTVA